MLRRFTGLLTSLLMLHFATANADARCAMRQIVSPRMQMPTAGMDGLAVHPRAPAHDERAPHDAPAVPSCCVGTCVFAPGTVIHPTYAGSIAPAPPLESATADREPASAPRDLEPPPPKR